MAEPLKIYGNESAVVVPMATRAPGVETFDLELRGSALFSTIYVESIDPGASISIAWKDYNPLSSSADPFLVFTQPLKTTTGYQRDFNNQVTHGTSMVEVTVAGGNARFGVFVTAITATSNYPAAGSTQEISGTITASSTPWRGMPKVLAKLTNHTTDQTDQGVIGSWVVPVGKSWDVYEVVVTTRAIGKFFIDTNAQQVGSGRTGPLDENVNFRFPPVLALGTGDVLELSYEQDHGPSGMKLEAYVIGTEIT